MFKAARASVLVLLLACSTQAGEMQNGTPAPPQRSVYTETDSTAAPSQTTGDFQESYDGGEVPVYAADEIAGGALIFIKTALAVL